MLSSFYKPRIVQHTYPICTIIMYDDHQSCYYIFIQNSLDFSHWLLIPLFKFSSKTSFEKDTNQNYLWCFSNSYDQKNWTFFDDFDPPMISDWNSFFNSRTKKITLRGDWEEVSQEKGKVSTWTYCWGKFFVGGKQHLHLRTKA